MVINWIIGNEVFLILGVIGLIVFSISKWILRNRVKEGRYRNFLSVGAAFVCAPIIYVTLILSLLFSDSYYTEIEFSQAEWVSNPDERFKMSEDVIDSRMLIGKTQEEVTQILGNDFSQFESYRINYYIGFVPGMFRIDPDVLEIRFANGVVAEVKQRET